jgi:hypothetical protein
MVSNPTLFYEYIYARLVELEDEQEKLIQSLRTKKGIILVSDRLRVIELEKLILIRIYEDFRNLL